MSILRLLLYVLLGVVAFAVVSAVVSVVLAVLSFVWSLVVLVATLAVFGAVGYGVYRLWQLTSGSSEPQSFDIGEHTSTSRESVDIEPESRVDRIKDRYANGDLSEGEMERLLEREIDSEEYDSIDRELQRER